MWDGSKRLFAVDGLSSAKYRHLGLGVRVRLTGTEWYQCYQIRKVSWFLWGTCHILARFYILILMKLITILLILCLIIYKFELRLLKALFDTTVICSFNLEHS